MGLSKCFVRIKVHGAVKLNPEVFIILVSIGDLGYLNTQISCEMAQIPFV